MTPQIPWLEMVTGLLALLTSLNGALAGWALIQIVGLKVKVAENKATSDAEDKAHKAACEQYQREVDRRFKERQDDRIRESGQVCHELKKLEDSVTRIHQRMDEFLAKGTTH